jgi:hypothetical protein
MSDANFSPHRPGTNARRGAPGPTQNGRRANDHRNGPWGNKLASKQENVFRYCFANIYGLPISVHHDKHDQITHTIKHYDIDVLGLAELNLNFPTLTPNQQWIHRFPKLPTNSNYSINEHSTSQARKLYGGTAYITNPATSPKVNSSGADPTGLGRWTWVKLTGRQGLEIRIINGYRPVRDNSNRAGTVYSQQEKHFMEIGEYWEPRLAFLDDLEKEIIRWKDEGNLIILGADLNDDTWTSPEAQRIEQWGLKNALKQQHPTLPPVATCNKNRSNKPIDGIWCSHSLDILAAGMLGFGSPNFGYTDHRMLWIDIDIESVFGYRPPPAAPIQQVGIPLRDPSHSHRFNRAFHKARSKINLPNQLFWLEHRALNGLFDKHDAALYEHLIERDDQLREQCKIKIRKKYAGQVLFSDAIGDARKRIRLWNHVNTRLFDRRIDTRKIRRLMQQLKEPNALRMTAQEVDLARTKSITHYKKIKKDARELRLAFQRQVNTRRAHKYNTSIEAQEKVTKNAFRSKGAWKRINRVLAKKERAAITFVEYTDEFDITHESTDTDTIYQACSQEGLDRYGQCYDTPFMQPPLQTDFGFLGNQTAIDQVLDGTYQCPPDTPEYVIKFIQELRRPSTPAPTEVTGHATTEEHIKGWKRMRTHTAASTFGPSFSEFIAGTNSEPVAEVDAAIVSIAAAAGYCPLRWSTAIDVMIPKKKLSRDVKKLRIIVLFHALFNMLNKRVAQKAINNARDMNEIPSEAYAKKGHRAIDCGLNKVLTLDIIRQRRVPAALCCNDAKQCYDRILHMIANICLQRVGVHPKTCFVMLGTLQQMKHHIKTAFGVSKESYGCIQIPLQGVLQGNGAGPAIWMLISIPLINMLRTQGFGFKSTNLLSGEDYQFACYTYVDDTDLIHIGDDHTTPEHVFDEMQRMLDHWEGGLRATGGALVPEKSYWYGIDFYWDPTTYKWKYKSITDLPGSLRLRNHRQEWEVLQRLEVSDAQETLGIFASVDGNQKAQVAKLHEKILGWADKISTKQLSKTEIWLSLRLGIAKSLRYPLTATTLSKNECYDLQKPLLKAALKALGFPATFPRNIVFAPPSILGLGVPNMWNDQGIDHITAILKHGDSLHSNITGCLQRDEMARLRFELGLPENATHYPYKKLHLCTTPVWYHITWQFCNDQKLTIKDTLPKFKLLRQHDQYIMQAFLLHGYSARNLQLLNLCRMWVRAITLTDITTGNGRFLQTQCRNRQYRRPPLAYQWPKTVQPDQHCWKLWLSALEKCFLRPDDPHHRLRNSLGHWIHIPTRWDWFYSPTEDRLFERSDHYGWHTRERNQGHQPARFQGFRRTNNFISDLPTDATPTTISGQGPQVVRHEGITTVELEEDDTDDDEDICWWNEPIEIMENIVDLVTAIQQGTAICVTDGSYKTSYGTAALIILPCLDAPDGITLVNQTPGSFSEQDPYRAELGGIYGCLSYINQLAKRHNITTGTITIACDCWSALLNVFFHEYDKPSQAQYDLVHACRLLIRDSPITWLAHHVQGHQDDYKTYQDLDRWGQLNVDMDSLAKAHWQTVYDENRAYFSLPPTTEWSLWHDHHRITSWSETNGLEHIYQKPSQSYWIKKQRIPPTTMEPHWTTTYNAFHNTVNPNRLWLTKWLTGWLPTGSKLLQWNATTNNLCPRCGQPETTKLHVVFCKHNEANHLWLAALERLEIWMTQKHTQPELQQGILQNLQRWHDHLPPTSPTSDWPGISEIFTQQNATGWRSFFDGFINEGWIEIQQAYYTFLEKRNTGRRWASQLIRKFWSISWDLWRHRMKIAETPDNASRLAHMALLDDQIQTRFEQYEDNPLPELRRWFSQPMQSIQTETEDFKEQWIQMVDTASKYFS